MNGQVLLGAILITAALVAYTFGVWWEFVDRTLRARHTVMLGIGLGFDATATWLMTRMTGSVDPSGVRGALLTIMSISGAVAIGLMAIHLAAAIVVLIRNRSRERRTFRRFSIAVWAVWLVPYFAGLIGGVIVPGLTS